MKPSVWKSPVAWGRRKLKLKFEDAIKAAGYKAVAPIDFTHMTGGDFAHVIDVGVADGTPDLYSRFPNAFLDLFEPHPDYLDHLERTVLSGRAGALHRVALGSRDETASLFLKGRTGSTLSGDRGRGQIEIPVRRLDGILKPEQIRGPCLLKIDTEGFEMEVLRGAEALLPHIDCIVSEVHFTLPHMYRPSEIIRYLAVHGFELEEMLDHHSSQGRVWCADFVFRRAAAKPGV